VQSIVFLRLAGDTYIRISEIVYVRPSESGGSMVELAYGRGFADPRTPAEIMAEVADIMNRAD